MAGLLKSQSSNEVIEQIKRIEDIADGCVETLAIRQLPWNLAMWATMVGATQDSEEILRDQNYDMGAGIFRHAMANLSMMTGTLIYWASKYALKQEIPSTKLHFTFEVQNLVSHDLEIARHYINFLGVFPMWHKGWVRGELIAPNVVRFEPNDGALQQRLRAYQQAIRPAGWIPAKCAPEPISLRGDETIRSYLLETVKTWKANGTRGFSYNAPPELYRYSAERISELLRFRRIPSSRLNGFSLDDFRRYFSALIGICLAHDALSREWWIQSGKYPTENVVMFAAEPLWVQVIADASTLRPSVTQQITRELTFENSKNRELNERPFVRVTSSGTLAVSPHMVLKSTPEDDLLRTYSIKYPSIHNALSLNKEEELRQSLISDLPSRLKVSGPFRLPGKLPDIDLVITEEGTNLALIAELKWLRNPGFNVFENEERAEEFLHGYEQIRSIRSFLRENPAYLLTRLGYAANTAMDYIFALVGRDYLKLLDDPDGIIIVSYEAFKSFAEKEESLAMALNRMQSYEWLPELDRDFHVRYERTAVNGAVVETEFFYHGPGQRPNPQTTQGKP